MSQDDHANAPDPWEGRDGDTVVNVLVVIALIGLLVLLLTPQVQQAGAGSASREKCMNNLKQIAVALHTYHDAYGSFPPAYVVDEPGTPLYSWRVLVLPYLDQQFLYEQFHLDESWDSPHNAALLKPVPSVFRCPTRVHKSQNDSPTCTHYAGVFGSRCVFQGAEPTTLSQITDDHAETLLAAEVTDADIPWSAPRDVDVTQHPKLGDRQGLSSDHPGGLFGMRADGAVRFVLEETDADTVRRLMIRNDGDEVGEF